MGPIRAVLRNCLAPRLRGGDLAVTEPYAPQGIHSVHKWPRSRKMIRTRGADPVWQPCDSPEFNACEKTWPRGRRRPKPLPGRTRLNGYAMRVTCSVPLGTAVYTTV